MAKASRTRGTGSLARSNGGKWVARWIAADGRERKRSTGTSDRRDAEAILAGWLQREARVRAGLEAPDAERKAKELARPLREHLADYLEAFERQESRTAGTMRVRRSNLGTFIRLSRAILRREPALRDLTADLIERVMHRRLEEGKAPRTANAQRQYILAFAAWATKDGRAELGHLGQGVGRRNEERDRRRVRRALSISEESALLEIAGARRLVYRTALATGLRRSELASLTWPDLDLDRGVGRVWNSKVGRFDEFNLLPDLAGELRDARPMFVPGASPRVFASVPTAKTVRRDLERAGIARIDLDGRVIDFHALRGTLGTRLAKAGIAPQVAKEVMRHKDYRTTAKHYSHLTLLDQRAALEKALEVPVVLAAEGTTGEALEVPPSGTSRGTSRGTYVSRHETGHLGTTRRDGRALDRAQGKSANAFPARVCAPTCATVRLGAIIPRSRDHWRS
jgi:integrase